MTLRSGPRLLTPAPTEGVVDDEVTRREFAFRPSPPHASAYGGRGRRRGDEGTAPEAFWLQRNICTAILLGMPSVETLIEPLRHSPQLVEAVDLLNRQIAEERERRQRFYAEMTPDQKTEFIDGEVILHSPARNRHLDACSLLMNLVSNYVRIHRLGTVKLEKCLCVFPRNDYEPDIVFFGEEKAASLGRDTLKFPIPDFVVEVLSESTEERDRGVKFEDYAVHGVGEYWMVDPVAETVEQYLLREGAYELRTKSSTGILTSEVIRGFTIPVRAVFDDAENLATLRSWL